MENTLIGMYKRKKLRVIVRFDTYTWCYIDTLYRDRGRKLLFSVFLYSTVFLQSANTYKPQTTS